jgi:hypothetical protein
MDNPEEEYQCSECGADVSADAKTCPNCGANLEEISEEENLTPEEFFEISISSDPITLSTIESLLKANKIKYSLDDSIMDPVLGYSHTKISKLLIPKNKIEIVEKIFREYEGKINLSKIMNTTGSFETDKKLDAELLKNKIQSLSVSKKRTRGFLLFFSFFLIFLLPLINLPFNIYYFFKVSDRLNWLPALGSISEIVLIISILIVIYGIYVGILIWRVHPSSIKQANRFLNVYLLYSVLIFFTAMAVIPLKYIQTNNIVYGLFKILFVVTVFSIMVIVNWKIYLRKSERVKETFTIHLN